MEFRGSQQSTNPGNNVVKNAAPPRQAPAGGQMGSNMMWEKHSMRKKVILAIIVAVLIIGCLGFWFWKVMAPNMAVKGNQYQAVFLTNGQVYFGKLSDVTGQYVKLSSIYYLQVQQSVQPEDKDKQQPQVSLAKLGGELHGPEDAMFISRDQILFWENITDDSKVVNAIKENEKK